MVTYVEQANNHMAFITQRMQQQADLERYVNEAILMANGENTIENIETINEGIIESTKGALNKIAEFIKKMWNKFLEAMNGLVRTNKAYLEKYKDKILKTKFKEDYTASMYNYQNGGVRNIKMNMLMPYTNEDQLVKDYTDKSAFIQKNFADMCKGFKPPYDEVWDEICKAYFHGGEQQVEFKAADLDNYMKDMYDYCYNYETAVKNVLQKDYDNFMNNAAKQLDALNTAQNRMSKQGAQPATKTESSIWEERKYYSHIYETYITEELTPAEKTEFDDLQKNTSRNDAQEAKLKTLIQKSKEKPAQSTNNGTNNQDSGKKPGDADVKTGTDNTDDQKNKLNVDASKANNEEELKKLSTAVTNYVNIGQVYLTNRMSAAEGAYKAYMKIIKEHVKSVVTDSNPDARKTAGTTNTDTAKVNDTDNGGNAFR